MTEMCCALFKHENERTVGWNDWLTTWYFTQTISRVEKGDVLGWTPSFALTALRLFCNPISMLLSTYLAATRAYCSFNWVPYLFCSADLSWKKLVMVDLLFKQMRLMIRFFICSKNGPLLLFNDCLNITIMWNVLNFMVWIYFVALFSAYYYFRPPPL